MVERSLAPTLVPSLGMHPCNLRGILPNFFAVILSTTSTCAMLVSVLHLVNSVGVFVLSKIISTAWRRMQYTSAGLFLFHLFLAPREG